MIEGPCRQADWLHPAELQIPMEFPHGEPYCATAVRKKKCPLFAWNRGVVNPSHSGKAKQSRVRARLLRGFLLASLSVHA